MLVTILAGILVAPSILFILFMLYAVIDEPAVNNHTQRLLHQWEATDTAQHHDSISKTEKI